ncbi:MAG TPA: cadherin-like domain-containing protein [Ensifer sp.]|uniref:cadherin-like domain-containing protein n=1 Tax=Ensifer sp. TaxID=1872086 RepID=UPI002E112BF5|nr:cadherin-like domain-containing protein [Ensifer sp.]
MSGMGKIVSPPETTAVERTLCSLGRAPPLALMLQLEPRFMFDAAGVATASVVTKADPALGAPSSAEAAPRLESFGHDAATRSHGDGAPAPAPADTTTAIAADVGPFGSKGEAQLEQAANANAAPISEIVFVDGRLPDLASLEAKSGVQIVILDAARDGIAQVSEVLASYHGDLAAIHFIGHGESGEFGIGTTDVTSSTLSARTTEIAGWGHALKADGDILIWGCDVAQLPAGQALINGIAALTSADVAASMDATGSTGLGGNWTLEAQSGVVEASGPFLLSTLATWDHLLDTPTITGGDTGLRVQEPSSLNDAGASSITLAELDIASSLTGDTFTVSARIADTSVGTLSDASGLGSTVTGGFTFTGSLADANAWLDQLSFTAVDVERGNVPGTTSLVLNVTNETDPTKPTSQRSVRLDVTPSNDPVQVNDSTMAVVEGSTGTVVPVSALPATDPEVAFGSQNASQIVYRLTATPTHGYLTLAGTRIGAGSVFTHQDVINGSLVYVHDGSAQDAPDTFSVLANDGATPLAPVDLSDPATVTITITPVNQPPTVSGSGTLYEGQPANATLNGVPQSVVGLFITADGGGDPTDTDATLQVQITGLAAHGLLYFSGTAVRGGVSQSYTNHQITQADVDAGFVFAYQDRSGLTYANDGLDAGGRPPSDSFNVLVRDGGGGTGTPLTATASIALDIRALNDEPVWVDASTLAAVVPSGFIVQLTTAMMNVTDTDSAPESLTFRVTDQSGLDQGSLVMNVNGVASFLPVGGSFTLADVIAGRVYYYQTGAAVAGDTDTFVFQVVDNGVSVRWGANGEQYERASGIYTNPTQLAALRDFPFTITLREVPTATGAGDGLPIGGSGVTGTTSGYAGQPETDPTRALAAIPARGVLVEGGTIVLSDGSGLSPGMNYSGPGIDPAQVIYTIVAFNGGDFGSWNGQLQRLISGSWVTLGPADVFTQADLNAGAIRFVHDGGEDFESSMRLIASAGIMVDDGTGNFAPDQWVTDFSFYVTPVNDAPIATGSTDNALNEGETFYITTAQLNFADADDATSESYLEGTATLPASGGTNYADNNGTLLTFGITSLPAHGILQYWDGSAWQTVTGSTVLEASWITADAGTTRLRYVHDGGEDQTDSFLAQATDRWSATSNIAPVSFVITPVNDPPQIAADPTQTDPVGILPGGTPGSGANEPLFVTREGTFNQITSAMLQAVDPDSSATQVQYRITTAPTRGLIAYSTDGVTFTAIGAGASFTQDDVNNGRIYYLFDRSDTVSPGYPGTPDDKFVFTLAEGAAEQTGREFWTYAQPINDRPVVTAPAGPINSTDVANNVPGFGIADPDLTLVSAAEEDFLQATVRLLHADGTPLGAAEYLANGGLDIQVTAGGATIDADKNGQDDYLVMRGTSAQVNAALATLAVTFGSDRDLVYQVQVIADDRVRDTATGAFLDRNSSVPGTNPGGNGGGILNQGATGPGASPTLVTATEPNWYADAAPTLTTDALYGNIHAASVVLYASSDNDPATLDGNGAADVYEDQASPIGAQISFVVSDPESNAFGTPVTVTLTVPSGILNVATTLPDGMTVTGRDSATLVIVGVASDIQTLLNSSLTYRSDANLNEDLNAAGDGDVTLTISLDDTGSNIGSGGASNNPLPIDVALTIIPVNDAPTVTAGTGIVPLTGVTPVPGFSVADLDIADAGGIATGESDFIQVTVRATLLDGTPVLETSYDGTNGTINIGSSADVAGLVTAGLVIDPTFNGTGSALVLRGTLSHVNSYLAGLNLAITGAQANNDLQYRIEVIADDRLRDASGALIGTAANGGEDNLPSGGTSDVPTTAVTPYAAVPGGLTANVATASRIVFPTSVNDPAEIGFTAPTTGEASATFQLSGIAITDVDAIDRALSVVVTLPAGFTAASVQSPLGGTATLGSGNTVVNISGTLDQINAAINTIVVNLPDEAGAPGAADWNGSFSVTIEVNDLGNTGSRPGSLVNVPDTSPTYQGTYTYEDPTASDGDPANDANLITTRTITFDVDPVNDAPIVIDGNTETLAASLEDTSPAGATVASLFASHFSDPVDAITGGSSSNSFIGVIVVGLATDSLQGTWQYFDTASSRWTDIGARAATNALYLASGTLVRFQANPDFHGTPNTLTVRLVEDGDGGNGSSPPTNGTTLDATTVGGITRYSADTIVLSTSVTNVNDRPSIGAGTLSPVLEDTASPPGATVGTLFSGGYSDATDNQTANHGGNAATAFGGIAIVGNASDAATEGRWEYSINAGASWAQVSGSLSDASALLLPTDALLRFLPVANFNGTPGGLTVRAADTAVAFNASTNLLPALASGQTSTWSLAQSLGTSVRAVNDAPVLSGTPTNPTVVENNETGTGSSIPPAALITGAALADLDLATTPGLATGVFGAGSVTLSLGATYRAGDVLSVAGSLPAGVTASAGTDGTLVLTLDADTTVAEVEALIGQLRYSNTSDNPTNYNANTTRTYVLSVLDGNNDQGVPDAGGDGTNPNSLASNTLVGLITITPTDDPPTANDDARVINEDTVSVSGNVIAPVGASGDVADTDPDTAVLTLTGIGVSLPSQAVSSATVVAGTYGTLTINPDGSYVYVLDRTNPAVNGLKDGDPPLSDVFTYRISDGTTTDDATLTIDIIGVTDGPPSIVPDDLNGAATGQNTVLEHGLTSVPDGSEAVNGTIAILAPDGLASVVIGGRTVTLAELQVLGSTPITIASAKGTLTLTGFAGTGGGGVPTGGTLTYTYTLSVAQNTPGASENTDVFALQAIDAGGDGSALSSLTIQIIDDVPVAQANSASITEDATPGTVSGNVVTDAGPGGTDAVGADGSSVTGISFSGSAGTIGASLTATYGSLVVNADGSYTYTLDNDNAAVNALKDGDPPLSEVFTYILTDGDGDTSSATLTITINGHTDGPPSIVPDDLNGVLTGENTVFEHGLVDASGQQRTLGTIAVTAPDGLASLTIGGQSVTLADLAGLASVPVTIATADGTLTLTGFSASGSVGGIPTGGTLSYAYEISAARNQPAAIASMDAIALQVVDAGGSIGTGTLTILIVDDVPAASGDSAAITENAVPGVIGGNVLLNDAPGADGYAVSGGVTGVTFNGLPQTVGSTFATAHGTLVLNADGTYSYQLDNDDPDVNSLTTGETLTETISYAITDGDGDVSTAVLTITINGFNDPPVIHPLDHVSGREDQVIVFGPGDFVFDPEGDLLTAVRITALPARGTMLFDGIPVSAGAEFAMTDVLAGKLTFAPDADGNGFNYANFTFQVSDGTSFSAPGNMRLDIVPVNDTPSAAGPLLVAGHEDTPLLFDGGAGADHAPVLSIDDLADRMGMGYTDAFTLTLSVSHGRITVSDTAGVTGTGSGATLTLAGTRDALNAALATLSYLAHRNYSGTDQLVLTVDDHINAGAGPDAEPSTATHVTEILVAAVADEPILIAPVAAGVEDHWVPLDIVVVPTDLSGIEIVTVEISGLPTGWQIRVGSDEARKSTGGADIFQFSLADLNAGISVLAPPNINTAPGQFYALDVSAISKDGLFNSAVATGQVLVSLQPENDRPLAGGGVVLPPSDPTLVSDPGHLVAVLFAGNYIDVVDNVLISQGTQGDTPLAGIAISANAATAAQGVWEFNLGDGSGWRAIPTSGLGETSALILPASASIRFTAAADFSGRPGMLTAWLSDGTGFPAAAAGSMVDITASSAGALGTQTGGWSQAPVPVTTSVNIFPPPPPPLPPPYVPPDTFTDNRFYGEIPDLEGFPSHLYTTALHYVTQQVIFRLTGSMETRNLFFEASLRGSEPLPSWISFDRSTQIVTALPPADVAPGIYLVHVLARDSEGNEAVSTVAIHVLRDTFRWPDPVRKPGTPPNAEPPPPTEDTAPTKEGEPQNGEAPAATGERTGLAPSERPDGRDARLAAVLALHALEDEPIRIAADAGPDVADLSSDPLFNTLIRFGAAGRVIETARLLETLAADIRAQPRGLE